MSGETVDAVVVGASLRGLVTAYVVSRLGFEVALVDSSPRLGGGDGSFVTAGGTVFDHGLHVLDDMRSPLATRLFTAAVDGRVRRTTLRRGIALRGHVMPYAPSPDEMPDELRALLPPGPLTDDVGDERPTRDRLGRCYGAGFADLVYDEVLPSFPSEHRHAAFGVDESELLVNVYPWFFPRVEDRAGSDDESRSFHDRLRSGVPQDVLYPAAGGFGGFAEGFAAKLDAAGVKVLLGCDDLCVEVDRATHRVGEVVAGGRRYEPRHCFWAASWPRLADLLGLPCQDAATDRVMVGSFRFDRPATSEFHELLVGDPRRRVNRVHFPAAFRHSDEPLVQVEFAVPARDPQWPDDADSWRERWLDDLRGLGLLDAKHRVEEFDYRSFPMHFNGYGVEGEPLRDADPSLVHPGSNLVPVAPSMANLNVNRWVPRAVRDMTAVLAET